jgi:hypothetical protein
LSAAIVVIAVMTAAGSALAAGPPAGVSTQEWATIQARIEAEHHKITESDRPGKLYRADNPTQRFTAHFGAEDVLISPLGRGEPAWQLGLRLTSWGDADDLQPVQPAGAIADGNRVEYRRGPLTEWYVNTTMGLEQGFTIEAPPGDGIEELVLEMTVEGDLTAKLAGAGNSVSFRRENSNGFLSYSGLKAWDSVYAPLEARMELTAGGSRLRLVVAVTNVAWPVTVDPIFNQVVKLLPPPHLDSSSAHFGQSVAVEGDVMVAGLSDDENGTNSGAAYVFYRDQGGVGNWGSVARLTALDASISDRFGAAVAISGDTVIVGAYGDDELRGSAYVFQRDHGGPDAWGQTAKITAVDGEAFDWFGVSVSIDNDTAIVGAHYDDDDGHNSGSAYVFQRDHGGPGAWGQVAKITPPDGEEDEWFGGSVAIDGDTAVVGARYDDDHGSIAGSASIFQRNQGGPDAWGRVAEIYPTDGSELVEFGAAVSISGETVLVGAINDLSPSVPSGSAFVFNRNQGGADSWGQVAKLVPAAPVVNDFGSSVSIDGNTAVIGASLDDELEWDAGAAYIYERDHGGPDSWGQVAKIGASDAGTHDYFGTSVSIHGDTVVAGTPGTGGPGDFSGSVYVYERDHGGFDAWGESAIRDCPGALTAQHIRFGSSACVSGDEAIVGAPHYLNNGWNPGSAYIFHRHQGGVGAWGLVATLNPADGEDSDLFGTSVSIDGDTAVVGAHRDDDNAPSSGSAYVFQRDVGGPNAWGQVAKLTASDGASNDQFGISVSVSGDIALIGAWGDDYRGAAYVFERDHGGFDAWGQVVKITVPECDLNCLFGESVCVSGDTAIVGAKADAPYGYDSGSAYIFGRDHGGPDAWGQVANIRPADGAPGPFGIVVSIDGDTAIVSNESDDVIGYSSGSAYIFQRDQGGPDSWGQVTKIVPADGTAHAYFGNSVSISGDTALVGAWQKDDPDQNAGAAYAFQRDRGGPDAWGQVAKITPADAGRERYFGTSVAVDGDVAVIGSFADDEVGSGSGSAYVFVIEEPLFADGFETGDTSGWSATAP